MTLIDETDPRRLVRFARRGHLVVSPYNGNQVIAYLRLTRAWRGTGLAAGLVTGVWTSLPDLSVQALPAFLGWFAGVLLAEVRLARGRPAKGPDPGLRLVAPPVLGLWAASLVLSGVAVSASLAHAVSFEQRLWVLAAVAVAAAVHLLYHELRTRPPTLGTADLVGAELAIRSRSAHVLLCGGATAVLWCALGAGFAERFEEAQVVGYLLPILAFITATQPWWVTDAAPRGPLRRVAAVALAVSLVGVGAYAVESRDLRAELPKGVPVTLATSTDCEKGCLGWQVYTRDSGGGRLDAAEKTIVTPSGVAVPAPMVISPDGERLVYLDQRTRRLVHLDLPTGATRDLTAPLADSGIPAISLSPDGRHVALTATAVDLVDTRTGASTRLTGIARVLGLGPATIAATTAPRATGGAADTELVTLDYRGRIRTRTPFDPTLAAWLTPDGERLVVLTAEEIATMDPTSGRLLRRATMRPPLEQKRGLPEYLGMADDGRALVRSVTDGRTWLDLVDLTTGKTSPHDQYQPGMQVSVGRIEAS